MYYIKKVVSVSKVSFIVVAHVVFFIMVFHCKYL